MLTTVSCPNCREQGQLHDRFLNARIKCKKCGKTFVPADVLSGKPPSAIDTAVPKPATVSPRKPGDIEVEGLEESAWTIHHEPHAEVIETPPPLEPTHHPVYDASEALSNSPRAKSYKVLTTKDPFFKGKFELTSLEGALNYYAGQGWVVRSMGHPMIQGFSGAPKEELIILLER